MAKCESIDGDNETQTKTEAKKNDEIIENAICHEIAAHSVTSNSIVTDNYLAHMIEHICNQSDAFFRSQQRDEPDLTAEQKREIVADLYARNRRQFLDRYGKYFRNKQDFEMMRYFDRQPSRDDNIRHGDDDDAEWNREIDYRIARWCESAQAFRQSSSSAAAAVESTIIRRRRYTAMRRLLADGDYFSFTEMQSREPYLFDRMIGRYMNADERRELQNASYANHHDGDMTFASYLMEQIRTERLNRRYQFDAHRDQQEEEEEEEDEDEEGVEADQDDNRNEDDDDEDGTPISAHDKAALEKEFRDHMIENFLMGKDTHHFDYATVDHDADLDLSAEYEHDQEDRYFDDDDEEEEEKKMGPTTDC